MPKKTNDKNEIIDKIENVVNDIKNKVVKKETSKKTTMAKSSPKKDINSNSKSTPKKVASVSNSTTSSKKTNRLAAVTRSIKEEKKEATTSKNLAKSTKTTAAKKSTTPRKTTKNSTKPKKTEPQIMEYYDLPYRYNQTVVKILAQTPKMLFVYWDIADKDKEKYTQYYGEDFFTTSRPVLIIHNETMNYSFELEINDFANSWYIQVNDANCKYTVELGRRPNHYITTLKENYVYISSSNELDAPNDHILFEQATPNIKYKNIKNNQINIKDFSNSTFIKKILQTYSISTIEELYEKLYQKDLLEDFKNGYYKNPSSNPSSNFKQ